MQTQETSVQQIVNAYADTTNKWFDATENIQEIATQSKLFRCDYEQSMVLGESCTFATHSHYVVSDKYVNISNWVWKRKDGAEKFSFDSDAERDWADILKEISMTCSNQIHTGIKSKNQYHGQNLMGESEPEYFFTNDKEVFLWGKNYLPESTIKFEYYLHDIHASYPDFILKDKFGRVHIFEVKSLNVATNMNINATEYTEKIAELKKCYHQASKITGQYFYLPVQKGDLWTIITFVNGVESTFTLEQFRKFIIQP